MSSCRFCRFPGVQRLSKLHCLDVRHNHITTIAALHAEVTREKNDKHRWKRWKRNGKRNEPKRKTKRDKNVEKPSWKEWRNWKFHVGGNNSDFSHTKKFSINFPFFSQYVFFTYSRFFTFKWTSCFQHRCFDFECFECFGKTSKSRLKRCMERNSSNFPKTQPWALNNSFAFCIILLIDGLFFVGCQDIPRLRKLRLAENRISHMRWQTSWVFATLAPSLKFAFPPFCREVDQLASFTFLSELYMHPNPMSWSQLRSMECNQSRPSCTAQHVSIWL